MPTVREHLRTGTEVLDGLRGVAILLVLVFHSWLFSWYTPQLALFGWSVPVDVVPRAGYLGVEVFFVISGFVLFFPHAVRAVTRSGATHDVRAFALRRVAKIVPSYALALAFTFASLASLGIGVPVLHSLVVHALFINDFFDDELGVANSVFWSLAIEAQFYLIFPLVALAFRRAPVIVALFLVAVGLWYRVTVAPCCLLWEPTYRQLPAFLDVFGAGMFGAYALVWLRTHLRDTRAARVAYTLAALAALAACWLLMSGANAVTYDTGGAQKYDLYHRTLFAFAVAALAVASCGAVRAWRRIVANPVLLFFSVISYNLYLWHTLVLIWLWHKGVLPHATPNPHDDDHWKALLLGIGWPLAIGIATAITYFIERPILARIAPQAFAFDWSRVRPTPRRPSIASAEKRT